jgi:hypothetical protein
MCILDGGEKIKEEKRIECLWKICSFGLGVND